MSSQELPPPTGLDGKSVFNVFGYHGDRYDDGRAFSNPLEAPPLDAVAVSNVSQHQRTKNRRRSNETVSLVMAPLSPESAPPPPPPLSIPRALWSFFSARKMRVSVPETSRLAVQPLGSSQASPGPQVMPVASAHSAPSLSSEDQMAPAAHHLSRRYSKPQADEEGDVAEVSNQLLSRFSQTVTLSTGRLLRRGSGHINLYEKSSAQLQETSIPEAGELTSRVSVMPRSSLTRGSSSPNLQGMAQSAGMGGSNNSGGGLISRYLRRRGSMDTILPASALPTESAVDQASLALVPTTCSSSSPDVTSSSSSSSVTQYSPSGRSLRETPLIEEPSAAAMTPPAPRLGLLSRTRQFGAWISKATEGEKVEVSQKDLNTIVPNSF